MTRILHIVGKRLDRAGAETWLMHALRRLPRDLRFDFVVHTPNPGDFDEEARSLGARIFVCPQDPARPLAYARELRKVLRQHGPYDVVHSHTQHFSGYALLLARLARVPVRVAHSHLDTVPAERGAGVKRRAYLELAQRSILMNATLGLAASGKAGVALFGASWNRDPRFRTHYYGIDMTPFHRPADRSTLRAELGVPADALILGHAGRFQLQKNHAFLIEIAAAVMQKSRAAWLVLVGEGSLRPEITRRVKELGIEDRVVFTGLRDDVPRVLPAFDVFVMPSFNEGLPVVLMETQAAGLPSVVSDVIARENDTVHSLIVRCRLSQPPDEWADKILEVASSPRPTRAQALEQMEASPFNIEFGAKELFGIYQTATREAQEPAALRQSLLSRFTP